MSLVTDLQRVNKSAYCRAFRHRFDGNVLLEKRGNKKVWVGRLECEDCGTKRVDIMTPRSCELLARHYKHEDDYDTTLSSQEAKKIVFKFMIEKYS